MKSQFKTIQILLCLISLNFIACHSEDVIPLNELPHNADLVQHGEYLTKTLAACGYCHGQNSSPNSILEGGRAQYDSYGKVYAANLTPSKSGIGEWSSQEVVTAIRTSTGKERNQLSVELHQGFTWMSDNDVLAIVAYLNTLPPILNDVERREVGFVKRNTIGLFEDRKTISGFIPAISKQHKVEYGRYLVEHVARCTSCHNSDGGLVSDEKYLYGGRIIKNEKGEKIAPNISSSKLYGIGEWSEDQIVYFLRTGETPGARFIDLDFCPVRFYANAKDEDLYAIAAYLRTVPNAS
ncbi:MAG: hypothetical protein KDD56_00535 [Bdellovibrionales bacterium]|nr:hypothetical protein [Bdellovibrionales bacterium]